MFRKSSNWYNIILVQKSSNNLIVTYGMKIYSVLKYIDFSIYIFLSGLDIYTQVRVQASLTGNQDWYIIQRDGNYLLDLCGIKCSQLIVSTKQ